MSASKVVRLAGYTTRWGSPKKGPVQAGNPALAAGGRSGYCGRDIQSGLVTEYYGDETTRSARRSTTQ
jgi:hypothetical protein